LEVINMGRDSSSPETVALMKTLASAC